MSRIGFIGLGKLGLPVALVFESKGHKVVGYDVNPEVSRYLEEKKIPFYEKGIQPYLDRTKIKIMPMSQVIKSSELIFMPVQTPHDPQYEGSTRIPLDRKDFDYSYLIQAIKDVAAECAEQKKHIYLAVISTCLPGTFEREIKPILNEYIHYVYTPQFIAMGTVIDDILNPEFILTGIDDRDYFSEKSPDLVMDKFWSTIYGEDHDIPTVETDVTTAEGVKVSYNTYITLKTVLANTWGELSAKLGMNFGDIYRAWAASDRRLLSTKYLKAGMGYGGGCHPRDNIALSFIADKIGLSHNIFDDLMRAREGHAEWLANVAMEFSGGLPILMLGRAFKPETNIETGSPSILVANIIREKGGTVDHVEDAEEEQMGDYPCIFIGTSHNRYKQYEFPKGSTVVDPFGIIPDQRDVTVIRLGRY